MATSFPGPGAALRAGLLASMGGKGRLCPSARGTPLVSKIPLLCAQLSSAVMDKRYTR